MCRDEAEHHPECSVRCVLCRNQIAKIFETQRAAYDATERISLVSSFAASLFVGHYAPIERSDATGTRKHSLSSHSFDVCMGRCADGRSAVGQA
jgi:sugar (pentulose or hexulose) kinase